jgi:hypothetical protein
LSASAGANAARSIIGRVSGIAPSAEALAQAEPQAAPVEKQNSMFGNFGFGSLFGMGNKPAKTADSPEPAARMAMAAPMAKAAKAEKAPSKNAAKDSGKDSAKDKGKAKTKTAVVADKGDLQPSSSSSAGREAREVAATPAAPAESSSPVQFELKGVNVTARKSILTVAIKNSGQSDFSFNPDSFAVSENNHKLSEAAMRADFETTLVQPSQEVQGTITIFGRPWNDRLTVSLSDGTRNLQMHR